jgi:hypothetical protein
MSTPPRTIRRDTRVFISAATRELGSSRQLVKKALEDNDYHAVEQDNFPPHYRELIDMGVTPRNGKNCTLRNGV